MILRKASAMWEGTLKEGRGTMRTGSGAFEGPYSFATRFGDDRGTNPDELIAAADAELALHGYTPEGDPNRAYQACLKNALDKANNNQNFVADDLCPFDSPYDGHASDLSNPTPWEPPAPLGQPEGPGQPVLPAGHSSPVQVGSVE